jgi:hypothetical protein
MGRNGREYVVKNHSWESVARKVAEVYESAVIKHKNKRGLRCNHPKNSHLTLA